MYLQVTVCFLVTIGYCAGIGSGDTACLPPHPINCTGETLVERYHYDESTASCKAFQTCQENSSFATLEDCKEVCSIPAIEPCPNLRETPLVNADLIREPRCTLPNECSGALYSCHKDSILLAGSHDRVCSNGNWSEPPLCAKIEFYYNDEKVTSLTLNEGDSAVIECRVSPMFPALSTANWSELVDSNTREEWGKNRSSHNLIIESAKASNSKTYTCTVGTDIDSIRETFAIEVVEVTPSPEPHIPPTIHQVNVFYHHVITGFCPCEGSPKPAVVWSVNDETLEQSDNIDITDQLIHHDSFTLSQLVIRNPTSEHSGTYSCQCNNSAGSTSKDALQPITIPNETRKKREVTTVDPVTDVCELLQDKNTVAVVGSVLNHLRSTNLLHVKVDTSTSLEENTIIRVNAGSYTLPKRRPHILLLKQEGSIFSMQTSIPFSQTLYDHITSLC